MYYRNPAVSLALALSLWAWPQVATGQAAAPTGDAAPQALVDRTFTTINYQYRSGSTRIDFTASSAELDATGQAKVESRRGYLNIEAEFRGLKPARTFGAEYFTYVLWAVTPQGRAQNLGELVLRGDRSSLSVTTELQAFGLLVTAEPYFAITQPSDVVVLENAVRPDTRGRIEEGQARAAMIRRGAFIAQEQPDELTAQLMIVSPRIPLELYQARNAVRLVRWVGAERHARETFDKAVDLLIQAENYQARQRPETRAATMMARQAVQAAEDARLITIQRIDEERQALARAQAAEREAQALALAGTEAGRRAQAEADLKSAEEARRLAEQVRTEAEAAKARADAAAAQADRVRLEAERAAELAGKEKADADIARSSALAELERTREESRALQAQVAAEQAAAEQARTAVAAELDRTREEARALQMKVESERAAAEQARVAANAELERIKQQAASEVAQLEAARAAAIAQRQTAEADAARAQGAAETANQLRAQAERERAQLRERLQQQLNRVLETTNTARGLIVNMSDVLFDTARFTLRPGAREKLARISGILSIQPGLRVEVEGHTDSVGTDEYNQQLSEQRATAVRDYLVQEGIEPPAISARGYGESRPKVSNDTAPGRQQNRRVELVVSGEAIDSTSLTPPATDSAPPPAGD